MSDLGQEKRVPRLYWKQFCWGHLEKKRVKSIVQKIEVVPNVPVAYTIPFVQNNRRLSELKGAGTNIWDIRKLGDTRLIVLQSWSQKPQVQKQGSSCMADQFWKQHHWASHSSQTLQEHQLQCKKEQWDCELKFRGNIRNKTLRTMWNGVLKFRGNGNL